MKNKNKEKQFFRERLEELLQVTNEDLVNCNLGLEPGTYTAKSIVKKLGKGAMASVSFRIIQNDSGIFRVPDGNIFCEILYCEKQAGVRAENVNKWTIGDTREVTSSGAITFPSKGMMKMLAQKLTRIEKNNGKIMVLSLRDGCIRSLLRSSTDYTPLEYPLLLKGEGYKGLDDYHHFSFLIDATKLQYLYGECKISLHKNLNVDPTLPLNPYGIRIVIENSDGWSISSNEIVPLDKEYLKLYDTQFSESYEEDSLSDPVCDTISLDDNSVDNTKPSALIETLCQNDVNHESLHTLGSNMSSLNENADVNPADAAIIESKNSELPISTKVVPPCRKKYIEHRVKKLQFSRKNEK